MKKEIYIFALLVGILALISTQDVKAQKLAARTNFAHWAAGGSPNGGLELALGDKLTLDLSGGLNLWNLGNNRKIKHWIVQPELRYWFCDAFNGHFIGLHGHGGQLNIGNWDIPFGRLQNLKNNRYEGYFYGAGLSYGYQWVLSPQWNLELSAGGGWARMHYRRFDCVMCGPLQEDGIHDYFGVTRATISLIYFFK